MAKRPSLPQARNPMLEEERAPSHDILIERRCLGQTELKVKPGQVGTSNATKPDNLGVLDYAHLRVPLPKDLTGSGIFVKGGNRKWPEAYFLMRRSSDGFISATGMFKAAFPYAQVEEESAEKDYIKSLDAASSEEVAGNVWIDPGKALELAEEYGIRLWIAALLDPEPITHGTNDPEKTIQSPPAYASVETNGTARSTTGKSKKSSKGSVRARSERAESPTKSSDPAAAPSTKNTPRKMATPRKPRKPKNAPLTSVDETPAVPSTTSPVTTSSATAATNGVSSATATDTIKVSVENTLVPDPTSKTGEVVESTKVHIDLPASHPDLKIPGDAEGMLAQARAMVREAEKLSSTTDAATTNGVVEKAKTKGKGKRKADAIEDGATQDGVAKEGVEAGPATKKAKTVEVELRKERIRRRALTGIVASLAVGALIPGLVSVFGSAL